ncbi:GNAT family N-acetyltransferase [Nocardia otitidiscaviarum]|uniref:GNAT family N-acetyltransferase n=1 Tax=Nocardia otitidiscaviarum TaxID=1823 RepID=UPI0018930A32|nr:GNAT family N-acetyltransferase [Nocardia otitidiscaviarum]MBF6180753.1 GNAT family N-acetyltransferase [Nocardia otitidiscaviarum]
MQVTVRPATDSDIPELARVLGIAFLDDPVATYFVPDAGVRADRMALMYATLTRTHFLRYGGVDVVEDDAGTIVGAAVWAPPGHWHASTAATLRAAPNMIRAFRGRIRLAGRMAERMADVHPREPHWYLAFIGTLPTARGRGYGQALLNSRLDRCDAEGVPAYLESSKAENVPYYERFGFVQTAEHDFTDGGPLVWSMWREPADQAD